MWLTVIHYNSKYSIGHEKRISNIIKRANAEYHIENTTNSGKPDKIEQCISSRELVNNIIKDSNCKDNDRPYGSNK